MKNDTWELIDTWEDFGYKYRGHWTPRNATYNINDVVSFVIDGQEGHFICTMEHISDANCPPDREPEAWEEYDKEWRLKKKKPYMVHPHNFLERSNGTQGSA